MKSTERIGLCANVEDPGVGKKIAATLSSTGTPAAFLHPSEAVHGDLGIHQDGDTVIFLSNSGNTPELIFLEPIFRTRKSKM